MRPDAAMWTTEDANLHLSGWVADYPDAHNFLRRSLFFKILWTRGWHHARLEQLLEEAARTGDRARRLAMYLQADRILVSNETVVMPLAYSLPGNFALWKPWVKGAYCDVGGSFSLRNLAIESTEPFVHRGAPASTATPSAPTSAPTP
jgi:ABC-type oligopeptide transport system substrate-binding subunit